MAKEVDEKTERFKRRVEGILKELIESNGMEVYGNLKIEVTDMDTLALLKGNKNLYKY
jgi:hypothetical protein